MDSLITVSEMMNVKSGRPSVRFARRARARSVFSPRRNSPPRLRPASARALQMRNKTPARRRPLRCAHREPTGAGATSAPNRPRGPVLQTSGPNWARPSARGLEKACSRQGASCRAEPVLSKTDARSRPGLRLDPNELRVPPGLQEGAPKQVAHPAVAIADDQIRF